MAYDAGKVNYTSEEHARAQKFDEGVEAILSALGDGFQPIQDLPSIGMGVWGLVDAVRTAASESVDPDTGVVDKGALARRLAHTAVMLERDNGFTG